MSYPHPPRSLQTASPVVFLDESGFQLTPSVRRTFAPRGQTPVLECWDRRDRISAIRCITLSSLQGRPGLYFELLPVNHSVHAEEVAAFLKELRRQLRGPLTVVWDRHGIHGKSHVVQAFLARHADIHVEDFPGQVPELKPDEWVWGWTKYGRLSNLAAWHSDELWDQAVMALIDLKFQPKMLNVFLKEAGVPVAA